MSFYMSFLPKSLFQHPFSFRTSWASQAPLSSKKASLAAFPFRCSVTVSAGVQEPNLGEMKNRVPSAKEPLGGNNTTRQSRHLASKTIRAELRCLGSDLRLLHLQSGALPSQMVLVFTASYLWQGMAGIYV